MLKRGATVFGRDRLRIKVNVKVLRAVWVRVWANVRVVGVVDARPPCQRFQSTMLKKEAGLSASFSENSRMLRTGKVPSVTSCPEKYFPGANVQALM